MRTTSTRTRLIAASLAALGAVAGAMLLARDDSADAAPVSALGAGTAMGAVELASSDPAALAGFYTAGVGLEVLAEDGDGVSLGVGDTELLRIVATDAPADDFTEAGLYHSAFLFPDEPSLASAILRTAETYPSSFAGSADHTVSQAFYFADPDGNGVELYVDRPAESWLWTEGEVTMGSYALDPNAFIAEHLDAGADIAVADGVVMGHVHLRGGSLDQAEAFYEDALGMAVTSRATGALFFSADGYHHHLAVNVWSSEGAGPRPESQGLSVVTITVDGPDELDALERRLTDSGVDYVRDGEAVRTSDPWGTRIVVTA